MTPLDRAAYLIHARGRAFSARLNAAQKIIADHPTYAISTSWGKDSIVALHLAALARPDIAVVNARYPNPAERFADMDRVRDAVLARAEFRSVRYREVDTPGEWEMYERAGGAFSDAMTPEQKEATRWWKKKFNEAMRNAQIDLGADGVFLGLRAEESFARRINIATHGVDYQRKDGARIALPIARWFGRDIWAYLVAHDLPSLRIYEAASCGRERARSGFVFATGGAGALRRHGVWDDWRRVYPAEFSAWLARFPELDR